MNQKVLEEIIWQFVQDANETIDLQTWKDGAEKNIKHYIALWVDDYIAQSQPWPKKSNWKKKNKQDIAKLIEED